MGGRDWKGDTRCWRGAERHHSINGCVSTPTPGRRGVGSNARWAGRRARGRERAEQQGRILAQGCSEGHRRPKVGFCGVETGDRWNCDPNIDVLFSFFGARGRSTNGWALISSGTCAEMELSIGVYLCAADMPSGFGSEQ